jgi:hypothetical protein
VANPVAKIKEFVKFAAKHKGEENGEAHTFLDRLFQAFGHAGVIESGGEFECRVHPGKTKRFADLVWPRRVLIEMKKRGEKLQKYYLQPCEYWIKLTKDPARYVVLRNLDEFRTYDFDYQMSDPVGRVAVADLGTRYTPSTFSFAKRASRSSRTTWSPSPASCLKRSKVVRANFHCVSRIMLK